MMRAPERDRRGAHRPAWWDETNNKAMLICRVSDRKQLDGVSLAAQRHNQTEYCAAVGLNIAKEAAFQESAKDSTFRTLFHEAIKDARSAKLRHLVFFSADRLSRNFTDLERLQKDVRAGVFIIHFTQDGVVLWRGSSDFDLYMQEMATAHAKLENRIRSTKTIVGMEQRCRDGWYPSRPPQFYWQQALTDEHGRPKKRGSTVEGPTPEGRRLLRREMELHLEGRSLELVRAACLQEKLVPASMARSYFASTVDKHLKNRFYAALPTPHDGFRSQFTWRGETHDAKHEPVFTADEWARLQASFGRKALYRKTKHEGLFSQGLLRLTCAQPGCGCLMTYAPKTKKSGKVFRYYRCADGSFVHRNARQPQVNVREEDILDKLGEALDAICLDEPLAEAVADALNAAHRQAHRAREGAIGALRVDLEQLDAAGDRAYELLSSGAIDGDEFKRQRDRLKARRQEALEKLEQVQASSDDAHLVTAARVLELAKSAKKLWKERSPMERVGLLERMVCNPRVDGRNVLFDLKKPFAALAKMRESGEWRPQRDLNPR